MEEDSQLFLLFLLSLVLMSHPWCWFLLTDLTGRPPGTLMLTRELRSTRVEPTGFLLLCLGVELCWESVLLLMLVQVQKSGWRGTLLMSSLGAGLVLMRAELKCMHINKDDIYK